MVAARKQVSIVLFVATLFHIVNGLTVEAPLRDEEEFDTLSSQLNPANQTDFYKDSREAPTNVAFGVKQRKATSFEIEDVAGAKIGVPQDLPTNVTTRYSVLEEILEGQKYMTTKVMKDDKFKPVRDICLNLRKECATWAERGECNKSGRFMTRNCAPVCHSCEEVHTDTRCPLDLNEKNALYPGDLNKMFERVVDSGEFDAYDVTTHSRPSLAKGDTNETAGYMIGPWVITIDDFLSEEEAETLIRLGAEEGYKQSRDVGKKRVDGTFDGRVSKKRTSTNAWCHATCEAHNVTKTVTKRIVDLIQVPAENSEFYQMLRYEPGQFYGSHHDYIVAAKDRPQGPRILTVFLYLNDVEEGGATNFTNMDLAVAPKRGRVLIWPSVLDEDPYTKDGRTSHEAQKVIKGIKYGANAWYHMRNYRGPYGKGCV